MRRATRTLREKCSKRPCESSFAWKEIEVTFCLFGSESGSTGQVVSTRRGEGKRGVEVEYGSAASREN